VFFDDEGNLLDEKDKDPMEVARSKKISDARNQFEHLIQMSKNSELAVDFLCDSLSKLLQPLQQIVPNATISKQDEFETFIGGKIPDEVQIRPPTDIVSKGRTKRIKKSKEIPVPRKRKCGKCKQIVSDHDARNCPNNIVG
jgi:hypothetical protein